MLSYFRNFWLHPKTTAVGILTTIAIVGGALAKQGIHIGWLTTVEAVATALLGVLAKDPDAPTQVS